MIFKLLLLAGLWSIGETTPNHVAPIDQPRIELISQLHDAGVERLHGHDGRLITFDDATVQHLEHALRWVNRRGKVGTVVGDMVLIQPESERQEAYTVASSAASWNGRQYFGRVCSSSGCAMCASISNQLRAPTTAYRTVVVPAIWRPITAAQQTLSSRQADEMFDILGLTSADVYCDLGCGDGRLLIHAVREFGCEAIGVEIDPAQAAKARSAVSRAGLSDKITILQMDIADFDPQKHGVTKASAYLWSETLGQVKPVLDTIPVVVSYHSVPGAAGTRRGSWYTYHERGR